MTAQSPTVQIHHPDSPKSSKKSPTTSTESADSHKEEISVRINFLPSTETAELQFRILTRIIDNFP
jgi:hypothetical protein